MEIFHIVSRRNWAGKYGADPSPPPEQLRDPPSDKDFLIYIVVILNYIFVDDYREIIVILQCLDFKAQLSGSAVCTEN